MFFLAQQVKLPLEMPVSYSGAIAQVLATLFKIQLCANAPGKALENGPSAGTPPPTRWPWMQFLVPGFVLTMALAVIWRKS